MLDVLEAEYVDGYKVRVRFSNGESGIVDLEDALWGPVFEPLKNPRAFKRFRISQVLHTLCWESDADFAPEYLYEKMLEQRSALATGGQGA